MSNIRNATANYIAARTAAETGDNITAIRMAFAAQREASRCRATRAADLAFNAHSLTVGRAGVILSDKAADHCDRSEAGRVRAESQHLFNHG